MITSKPDTIHVLYKYRDNPRIHEGLVALLTPEYRWLLDIDILEGEVDQEWVDFDGSIVYYLDLTLGDKIEDLMVPNGPHEIQVLEYSTEPLSVCGYFTAQLFSALMVHKDKPLTPALIANIQSSVGTLLEQWGVY